MLAGLGDKPRDHLLHDHNRKRGFLPIALDYMQHGSRHGHVGMTRYEKTSFHSTFYYTVKGGMGCVLLKC